MRFERLYRMINILLNRKTTTAKELSEKLGVSTRTILRDVDTLSLSGVPIITSKGKQGGISIMEGYKLDKSILSKMDKKLLSIAIDIIKTSAIPGADRKLDQLKKLVDEDEKQYIEIDLTEWGASLEEKQRFEVIKEAILNNRTLELVYTKLNGERTSRLIYPHKLVYKSNSWYVYAHCVLRKDNRFFKLSRIHTLSWSNEFFQLDGLPAVSKNICNYSKPENMTLTVEFFDNAEIFFYDSQYASSIKKIKDNIYEVAVPKTSWTIYYLLSLGTKIKVLKPNWVVEELIDLSKNIIKMYNK